MERRRWRPYAIRSLCVSAVWLPLYLGVASATDRPSTTAEARVEIARGATTIGAVVAKKYTYTTIRRLIRETLEKNVQSHHDSYAFLVGAHLAAMAWIDGLSSDVDWRARARAHHGDIATWLRPRINLSDNEIARIVADAAGFPPAVRQRLLRFLRGGH